MPKLFEIFDEVLRFISMSSARQADVLRAKGLKPRVRKSVSLYTSRTRDGGGTAGPGVAYD